jgi:glycine cleavage system H lipoate-binding protein
MFPWIYEFHWTPGHLIFLGAFFTVIAVIATSVARALRKSSADLASGRLDAIRWHADFDELPGAAKRCRHDLTGELRGRTCPHGFDCGACEVHPLVLDRRASRPPGSAHVAVVRGIELPLDRLYHRAHTWVRAEADGRCTIGLDAFASRVIGAADGISLPGPGTRLAADTPACTIAIGGRRYPVISPVSGTVESSGGSGAEWWIRLTPDAPVASMRHLLSAEEIGPWIGWEMDRLETMASAGSGSVSLADGGELMPALGGHFDEQAMDDIRAGVLMSG